MCSLSGRCTSPSGRSNAFDDVPFQTAELPRPRAVRRVSAPSGLEAGPRGRRLGMLEPQGSRLDALQNERRIDPSEAGRIRENDARPRFARFTPDVKAALGIAMLQIDRAGKTPVAHRE